MGESTVKSDEFSASVFDPADLLEYQDGAIVSKTVIDRDSTTVTAFALDEGQRISEHTAPHDALLEVLDGTAHITINDTDFEVQAGEALIMPANEPHAVAAPSRFKMLLTMAR